MRPVELEPRPSNRDALDSWLERYASELPEEIEITQEIKNRDMALIPHPFPDHMSDQRSNSETHTVVMLNPMDPLMERLTSMQNAGNDESVATLLHEGHLSFGNEAMKIKGSAGVDVVSFSL